MERCMIFYDRLDSLYAEYIYVKYSFNFNSHLDTLLFKKSIDG